MADAQQTLRDTFRIEGTGLHEGRRSTATVHPAPAHTGFIFVRVDLPGKPRIPFTPDYLGAEARRTQLQRDGAVVHTCEHMISGLFGSGVDNAVIELDGDEPPACDGSAKAFADAALKAGLAAQDAGRAVLKVAVALAVGDEASSIAVLPGEGCRYEYTLDYGLDALPVSRVVLNWSADAYTREVAPARTFCLESEALALRKAGFGKGADTQNTLVVGPKGVIDNALRFKDEFARHKMLDLIGDLALAGCRIEGRVIAVRSGHQLNQQLAIAIRRAMDARKLGGPGTLPGAFDPQRILEIAPHRYPFLMIDRVIEVREEGTLVIGIKNVSFNEPFFQGHFPGKPVMPGVLQIEAMAQLGGLVIAAQPEFRNHIGMLAAVDDARFRRAVVPGDQLRIEARLLKVRRGIVEARCRCTVGDEIASEATVKFVFIPKEPQAPGNNAKHNESAASSDPGTPAGGSPASSPRRPRSRV